MDYFVATGGGQYITNLVEKGKKSYKNVSLVSYADSKKD